jgi:phosphoglycolate phosphatase
MDYDIVSFDLDGTLVDTAAEIAHAANSALRAHGIPPQPPSEISLLIGHGSRQLMLKLLARLYLQTPALIESAPPGAVLDSFEQCLDAPLSSQATVYAGAHDALIRLCGAGVRIACVTNKESRHARRVLKAVGLDDAFGLIVAGDTLPQRKPHGSVLRHVVRVFAGDTHRAAHVGDSHVDVQAARNAGVAAWAVPYGYNAGRPIAQAQPERIFACLTEVADHVLKPH